MATERLPMRHIREILRLKWTLRRSHREVARSLGISLGAVASVVTRASAKGADLGRGDRVERRRARGDAVRAEARRRAPRARRRTRSGFTPNCAAIGVTLELLHLEYLADHQDGYRYSAFCAHYRAWLDAAACDDAPGPQGRREGVRRLRGQAAAPRRPDDGRDDRASSSSSPCSARPTTPTPRRRSRSRAPTSSRATCAPSSTLAACRRWSCRISCGPALADPCRYEPRLQRTYAEWAEHYGTVVIPARPAKPRDKAKVEVGRPGRRALDPGAAAPRDLLHAGGAQRADPRAARGAQRPADEDLRRPVAARALRALRSAGAAAAADRPLSSTAAWSEARVNIDYHVDGRASTTTPSRTRSFTTTLDVRLSATTVEIFDAGARVAVHVRDDTPRPPHDDRRAHAEGAPGPPGMESVAPDPLGRRRSAAQTAALVEAILGRPAASGAGVSLLSGAAAPGEALRHRPAGSRLRPRAVGAGARPIATSSRSSSTASIGSRCCPTRRRPSPRCCTTTSVAPHYYPIQKETCNAHRTHGRAPAGASPRRDGRRLRGATARRRPRRARLRRTPRAARRRRTLCARQPRPHAPAEGGQAPHQRRVSRGASTTRLDATWTAPRSGSSPRASGSPSIITS